MTAQLICSRHDGAHRKNSGESERVPRIVNDYGRARLQSGYVDYPVDYPFYDYSDTFQEFGGYQRGASFNYYDQYDYYYGGAADNFLDINIF